MRIAFLDCISETQETFLTLIFPPKRRVDQSSYVISVIVNIIVITLPRALEAETNPFFCLCNCMI